MPRVTVTFDIPADVPVSEVINPTFLKGMVARLIVSYYKYHRGPGKKSKTAMYAKDKQGIPALMMMDERLNKYMETGNTEWLMDVANCTMIEFTWPSHRNAHFKATDDRESPGMPGEERDGG